MVELNQCIHVMIGIVGHYYNSFWRLKTKMFKFTKFPLIAAIFALMVSPGFAEQVRGFKAYETKGAFSDVLADLRDAIINRGHVIDYTGHINEMLRRTSKTVGSVTSKGSKSPYLNAQFMHFCSAKLSHEVVSANPQNIAVCPYVLFMYETKANPGTIHVGYRRPITGPSKRSRKAFTKIDALLDAVVKESLQ